MSGKEILDELQKIYPQLYKDVKSKCEDYSRIVLSQSKSGMFNKFKKKDPDPGVDRRTLFYGIPGESYDSNIWISVQNPKTDPFPITSQYISGLKPDDETMLITDIGSASLDSNESQFLEAKKAWQTLFANIPENNPIWKSIFDTISEITRKIIILNEIPNIKEIINNNPDFHDQSIQLPLETIFQYEIEIRHKIISK